MNYSKLYYHKTVDTCTGQTLTEARVRPHIPVSQWPEWANYLVRMNNGLAFYCETTPTIKATQLECIGRVEQAPQCARSNLPQSIRSFINKEGERVRCKLRYLMHCRFDWSAK